MTTAAAGDELLYKHTQIGWWMLALLVLVVGPIIALAYSAGGSRFWDVLGVTVTIITINFCFLRVTVDGQQLVARFGISPVKKRIPLSRIRKWSAVRNSWLHGWGIRMIPGGWMYNVSGLSAIELILEDGSRFRVGTDEPELLMQALNAAMGREPEASAEELVAPKRRKRWLIAAIIVLGVLPLLALPVVFVHFLQQPEVVVHRHGVEVVTPFYGYGDLWTYDDVTELKLLERLPHIGWRTNGFALAGTLRGWFKSDDLGEGKLFLEADQPPFVLIRLRDGYVIVGFEDPMRTRALYEDLDAAMKGRPPKARAR